MDDFRLRKIDKDALAAMPEAERREVMELMAQLDVLREQDPLQFFQPHAKQHDLMRHKEVALRSFFGGNRAGKTTVGIVDDLIQAVDWEACPEHLVQYKRWTPPFYCRILTPDFTATMEGVVFQKLREWSPRGQLLGDSWSKAYDKQNRLLRFKNGSWFQFMTYEQDLDKFGGAALHRVHYDEEPPEQIRKECIVRLIDYGGEELFSMTPLLGMSWMFTDIWEPWEKGELKNAYVVTVDMDDNPYLDQAAKERTLSVYSAEERRARKEGRFVHFGGLIYGEFSRDLHVRPRLAPEDLEGKVVYCGLDPGQRHMAAVVYCAIDYDGNMTVFDEIALKGATVAQVASEIRLKNAYWKVEPKLYVIDPAARSHYHQTGRSDQQEYHDHGIPVVPGQNSVTAGINNVKTRLQADPPALIVTASCPNLVDEFRRYRWASAKKSDDDPRESPIKKDDHLLDALRYVCMARPMSPRQVEAQPDLNLHERLALDAMQFRAGTKPRVRAADGGPGVFT